MDYIKISEVAKKWDMSERRIQDLCKNGRISGAMRWGRAWMIPVDATRPIDARRKVSTLETDEHAEITFPKDNPFLIFTDLYKEAGTAEKSIDTLSENTAVAKILQAQLNYYQGKIDNIYNDAKYLFRLNSSFNYIVSASVLLAMCAIWRGDISLWKLAKKHLCKAPCNTANDREILAFWFTVIDSYMYDTSDYPEWFKIGIFDPLPVDTYCVARVFYIKYLFISAYDLAKGKIKLDGVSGLGLMRTLPHIIEPMISQAKIEKTVIPEIYLRLMCATAYHNLGQDNKAIPHIDKAIELCLPDKLYGLLVEYRKKLDLLLDDRLALIDEEALIKVKKISKQFVQGWVKLSNILLNKNISDRLSPREHQVAKLVAFGLSNSEIAKRMHLSESSVKTLISMVKNKTGALRRSDFGAYI